MSGEAIGSFKLANKGAFVCEIQAKYKHATKDEWTFTDNKSRKIFSSEDCTISMDELGVPNGDQVQLYVLIDGGKNRGVDEIFIANSLGSAIAFYTVDRGVANANVHFQGILNPP